MITLTLERRWESVGLERRCTITGAEQVPSYLNPQRLFVPDHALFHIHTAHTLTGAPSTDYYVHVWPHPDERFGTAEYTSKGINRRSEPEWVSAIVGDLHARFLGEEPTLPAGDVQLADHYVTSSWANTETWSVTGADPVNGVVPEALTVGWIIDEGSPVDRGLPRYQAILQTALGVRIAEWGGLENNYQRSEDWPAWVVESLDASLARLLLSDPAPVPLG